MDKIAAVRETMLTGANLCGGEVIWFTQTLLEFSIPNMTPTWQVFYHMFLSLCREYDLYYSICGREFKVSCNPIR